MINQSIVSYLNINSIRNKFESLKTVVCNNLDIITIAETKLDSPFTTSQFMIDGFIKPFCYECKPTHIFLPYSQPSHSYYHISFVIFMPPTINIIHESPTILHQPHFDIRTFILVYWLLLRIGCFITFTFSQLMFDFINSIC